MILSSLLYVLVSASLAAEPPAAPAPAPTLPWYASSEGGATAKWFKVGMPAAQFHKDNGCVSKVPPGMKVARVYCGDTELDSSFADTNSSAFVLDAKKIVVGFRTDASTVCGDAEMECCDGGMLFEAVSRAARAVGVSSADMQKLAAAKSAFEGMGVELDPKAKTVWTGAKGVVTAVATTSEYGDQCLAEVRLKP